MPFARVQAIVLAVVALASLAGPAAGEPRRNRADRAERSERDRARKRRQRAAAAREAAAREAAQRAALDALPEDDSITGEPSGDDESGSEPAADTPESDPALEEIDGTAETGVDVADTSDAQETVDADLAGIPDLTGAPTAGTTLPAARTGRYGMTGGWRSWGSLNLSGDPAEGDQVASFVDLAVTAKASSIFSAKIAGRLRYRYDSSPDSGVTEVEAELRDAFIAATRGNASITVGQQVIRWGSADTFSPNDVINPVDLREGPGIDFETPQIPVLAARALYVVGGVTLDGVYVPIHRPHRTSSLRERWGLLDGQPLLVDAVDFLEAEIDPDIGSDFDDASASRPPVRLDTGSAGGRVALRPSGADLGFNVFYGWDRTPAIAIDPEVRLLAAMLVDPTMDPLQDPVGMMAIANLRTKVAAGTPLVTAEPKRRLDAGFDFTATNGNVILKAEAAYTPAHTLYTVNLDPVRSDALSWVLGVDYLPTQSFQLTVEGSGKFITTDPETADPLQSVGAEDTLVAGFLRYAPTDAGVQLQLSGRYSLFFKDSIVSPSLQLELGSSHIVSLAAVFLQGPSGTLGGLNTRNDFLFLRYQWLFL
jgi:hypothetical protein